MNILLSIISNARIINWGYNINIYNIKKLSAIYFYDYIQIFILDLSFYKKNNKVGKSIIDFRALDG
jgi:hypothetical protein